MKQVEYKFLECQFSRLLINQINRRCNKIVVLTDLSNRNKLITQKYIVFCKLNLKKKKITGFRKSNKDSLKTNNKNFNDHFFEIL